MRNSVFGVWCVYGPAGSLCPQKRSRMCAVQLLRVSVHERIGAAAEDVLLRVGKGEEAAEIPALRALLTERLTAAAEEIVGLFEETVAEYEDRAERSEREICRQRKLLDAVLKPQVKLTRADAQLLVSREEVPPEQQEWSSSVDQEYPEPPHIKEEHEELWTSQEREQLQGLEEADITKFTFTPVPVKSEEDDEEKPKSSQLHQRQTEQKETEADGEDCGGPEPARNSDPDKHPEPDTDDKTGDFYIAEIEVSCDEWEETREPQSGLNSLNNDEVPVSDSRCSAGEKPFSCSECDKRFGFKSSLKKHMRTHTGEKPFSCSVCKKSFARSGCLQRHMRIHTGEKPFSCSVCDKSFVERGKLKRHMRYHTGEKPFSCSVCKKSFTESGSSQRHMRTHTGEKRFSCSVCDQRFAWLHQLRNHQCVGRQSSQLHQTQTEENREAEPPASSSTEQEELWTSQEGEQLQGLEDADITKFPFTPVSVKSEDDEEKPQSSQLHQRQTEQMETEADGEDCGAPEPARNSEPDGHLQPDTKTGDSSEPETDYSDDWKETREPQSGLNSLNNDEVPVSDERCSAGEKPFSCSECDKRFGFKHHLKRHVRSHTGEKPFSCSVCKKSFPWTGCLQRHMRIHTGQKPFSCSVCDKCFLDSGKLKRHMRSHTGEKTFSCSVCNKKFAWRYQFKTHKCDSDDLNETREPQSGLNSLNNNEVPVSDKPFSCSECGKGFGTNADLKRHMRTHTGEKPFICSFCGKGFSQKGNMMYHMGCHTGEKPFSCSVCDRRFTWLSGLKRHKCVGETS